MKRVLFAFVLAAFAAFIVYGLLVGDFAETMSNGVTICLTCIGVA